MKMINGVSMIPFGLLAGFADQNEIRIIELAENGFRFRMAKNQKNIENTERFRICFYDGEISDYREIILQEISYRKAWKKKSFILLIPYLQSRRTFEKKYRDCSDVIPDIFI